MNEMNEKKKPLSLHAGDLLISSPLLHDPNFSRTVVLLIDRDESNGFLGLVLNRVIDITLSDISVFESSAPNIPLYQGGPVDLQRLFWLHTLGDRISGSVEIMPGLYVGGSFEEVQSYIESGLPTEGQIRFYLGYSGWVKGQLENEVEHGAWKVSRTPDPQSLLVGAGEEYWCEQVKYLGPDYRHWLMLPSNPSLN